MRSYNFFLIAILFLISCNYHNNSEKAIQQSDQYILDERVVILPHSIYNKYYLNEGQEIFSPNKQDIETVEEILNNAVKLGAFDFLKEPQLPNIKKYYRQYICYLDNEGNRIIYINAFCRILDIPVEKDGEYVMEPFDWKNEYVLVKDGGDCYWSIKLNLTTKEYFELRVNGV